MPPLPWSLSPHICILSSPDLSEVLENSSLPRLPELLQSFSPLPQVTTRTTSLTSVTHPSFALRFSDLHDVEEAAKEDEDGRAARTLDWISARLNHRAARWVEDLDRLGEQAQNKAPWWDELRKCVNGDFTPGRHETWNHPAAVIYAVSTRAPNPLQAITALQSRQSELPPWVDPSFQRVNLIIHPSDSPLSDDEVTALFNAVKKQFGLESFLLPLDLPSPAPEPVPIPAPVPKLPPPPPDDDSEPLPPAMTPLTPSFPPTSPRQNPPTSPHSLRMIEKDIQATAKFTREFVVMSLIPWMERCVTEWNEAFSSTRRLPSRLFSSTRRLFGSPAPSSPAPISPMSPSRSSTLPPVTGALAGFNAPPPQQRRLAEFATVLGDYKLAITIWETLRKDSKGGSDILPLVLAPSPTIPLHVMNALEALNPAGRTESETPPSAQLRALIYAIRWSTSINLDDFLSPLYEGERWLVWASRNSDEPPAGIMLAHAAHLTLRKKFPRRASLWYATAASRLEKSGIKPLTMYFLRKARSLSIVHPEKSLSPSFWAAEGIKEGSHGGFDAIIPGVEHPLGRLLYNTGDFVGAIKVFLGLLKNSQFKEDLIDGLPENADVVFPGTDKAFVQDFQVAFGHYKSLSDSKNITSELKLGITLSDPKKTRLRLPRDMSQGDPAIWELREEQWKSFWRKLGKKDGLAKSGKAVVDEMFWVDVTFYNPLDTDVKLTNLTLAVEETSGAISSSSSHIHIETVDVITLGARESRTVPFSIKVTCPASLKVTNVKYNFLNLLPIQESLGAQGPRLHDTPAQRQTPTYGPDTFLKVEIAEASHKLIANFVDDRRMVLMNGENKEMRLWLSNMGTKSVGEVWWVHGPDDLVWTGKREEILSDNVCDNVVTSSNSLLQAKAHRISLDKFGDSSVLAPGDSVEIPVTIHVSEVGEQELQLLLVHRQDDSESFHAVRVSRPFEVVPSLQISSTSTISTTPDAHYTLNLAMENVSLSSSLEIIHISSISPTWKSRPVHTLPLGVIEPSQIVSAGLHASPWSGRKGDDDTRHFVHSRLKTVLEGGIVDETKGPPSIDLVYDTNDKADSTSNLRWSWYQHLLQSEKRSTSLKSLAARYPQLVSHLLPFTFPLYHPLAVDFVVSWALPHESRSGHFLISDLLVGAGHGDLQEIIDSSKTFKVTRSMYAETQKEKMEILSAITNSEWNIERNPIVARVCEPRPVGYNFSTPFKALPVDFRIANHSLTHSANYVLSLKAENTPDGSSPVLAPPYSGRLTFRGTIPPSKAIVVRPKIWVSKPGTYSLGGWTLQTDVIEESGKQIRRRYLEAGPLDDRITVYDIAQ